MASSIFDSVVILENFTPTLRNKFKIIDDCYKVLRRYYTNYPISYKNHTLYSRYQIGAEFLEIFSLNDLDTDDMMFALNTIYSTIGIDEVVFQIANFTGISIKVDQIDETDKKLSITIVAETIFDLELFERMFTNFLNDVLMFQNLEFIYDLIVLKIALQYDKKLYNLIEHQNLIPCVIDEIYDVGEAVEA